MSKRWEHGSDFHLESRTGVLVAPWSDHPHTLWGSGRDAMRALLAWGRAQRGWQRVLVPSYYCQKVVAALARELPVASYADGPEQPLPSTLAADEGDVVIAVNLHGTRGRTRIDTRATVVEDHTHDPFGAWARESDAEFALASLRKTLPLPDGGVLWSPRGLLGPATRAPGDVHARAAADRLAGMVLKHDHLEGRDVTKDSFRACLVAGERAMATGELSGISAFSAARLPSLPSAEWYAQRQDNLATFRAAFGRPAGVRMLDSTFAITLVFERPELAAWLRESLIATRIYPAVLWSLEHPLVDVPAEHRELSRRMLTLHADARYDAADMRRVADTVRHFIGEAARARQSQS